MYGVDCSKFLNSLKKLVVPRTKTQTATDFILASVFLFSIFIFIYIILSYEYILFHIGSTVCEWGRGGLEAVGCMDGLMRKTRSFLVGLELLRNSSLAPLPLGFSWRVLP